MTGYFDRCEHFTACTKTHMKDKNSTNIPTKIIVPQQRPKTKLPSFYQKTKRKHILGIIKKNETKSSFDITVQSKYCQERKWHRKPVNEIQENETGLRGG